ncbi:hypothetical protein [Clostridium psychrophilum]|uniref:hypothetical protein n=1 Tax=Clostridium psychrophilum TaxID=132926 RepID=UPI001C0DA17A|nr:hypothetical protein [Clostridium psychrophilum]MBU3181227.1 hypothetical protein [Clostridium psychrophilum]
MKKSKNILTSIFTIIIIASIFIGTLLYAYQYTKNNSVITNSTGNRGRSQGQFQKKDGNKSQGQFKGNTGTKPTGNPPSGNFKKSEN